jgi:hypothetical protein
VLNEQCSQNPANGKSLFNVTSSTAVGVFSALIYIPAGLISDFRQAEAPVQLL